MSEFSEYLKTLVGKEIEVRAGSGTTSGILLPLTSNNFIDLTPNTTAYESIRIHISSINIVKVCARPVPKSKGDCDTNKDDQCCERSS